jgi:hypothetical protein
VPGDVTPRLQLEPAEADASERSVCQQPAEQSEAQYGRLSDGLVAWLAGWAPVARIINR